MRARCAANSRAEQAWHKTEQDKAELLAHLRAEREALQSMIEALNAKHAMIVRFSQSGPEKLSADAKPLDIGQWSAAWDMVATGLSKLADELRSVPPDTTGEAAEKRVDLQQRHDFTARNFAEIRRTIGYACAAPVALDARLGAWARALQAPASD